MNPDSASEAVLLAKGIEKGISKPGNEVVIAPPFPFLSAVKKVIKRAKLGAQDDFWENSGAHTGEVSPAMLKNSGVEYVIIGHSERRRLGETDEMINKKIKASLKAGLKAILCVGEPKRGTDLRFKNYELRKAKNYVRMQLNKDLKGILKSKFINPKSLIVAYEPIWAIGTGKSDKPEDTTEMAKFIKGKVGVRVPVLYGGSVTSQNAGSFLKYKEIDGALVGGASLKSEEFNKIINIK